MSGEVLRWAEVFIPLAESHNVPPALVAAVIDAESGGNSEAVSPAGAQGLMQLMPATAQALGVSDPFNPIQNVEGGVSYLAEQYRRFGSYELALAAYNAGPGAVAQYGGVPPFGETQLYVARVARLLLDYLSLDLDLIRADEAIARYAPTHGTYREAALSLHGVSDVLSARIRRFVAENQDLVEGR